MRKRPRQQRSQTLVDDLIEAAALTISREGLARATTARIAERAGVSVGSLYQYFGDKHQLYDAVPERMTAKLQVLIDDNLSRLQQGSVRTFTEQLLQDVWQFLDADDGLYLGVVQHWAQLDFLRYLKLLEQRLMVGFGFILMGRDPAPSAEEVPARSFILINSVLFTIVRYISDPPAYIPRQQLIEQFAVLTEQMFLAPPRSSG